MSKDSQPRPAQATLAAWLIVAGSVVVVLTAFQRVASLRTLEAQERLQQTLSEPPFSELGLTVDTATRLIHVLCLVGGGAATAAAILGAQVFRRSTSARLGLSILAPLILVGGFATSGFFAPLVVAGITLLWLQPTRDWYAGRPWAQLFEQRRTSRVGAPPPVREPVEVPSRGPQGQPATPAPSQQPPAPYAWPAPYAAGSHRSGRPPRPPALIWACVLTWVSCALFAGGMALTALTLAVSGEELFAEFERQQGRSVESYGMTLEQARTGMYVSAAIVVLWCAAAAAFALLAFLGRGWARIALVVSGAVAGVLCLAAVVANPVLIILVGVIGAAVALLLRRDVAEWFRRSRTEVG